MLTLEQMAARYQMIKKAQKKIDKDKAARFTERRRDLEEKMYLKQAGAL